MQHRYRWGGKPIEHLTRDEMLEALQFVCDKAVAWKAQAVEIMELAEKNRKSRGHHAR